MYICIGYVLLTIWGIHVSWMCWYWIYHANTWGINVIWNVYVCPSAFRHTVGECTFLEIYICNGYMLPKIWGIYVSWIYVLILDISCQHLGDECKLEGFCVPFGHRVRECTFLKMYICIGYVLPTIWGIWVSWIYIILHLSCQY